MILRLFPFRLFLLGLLCPSLCLAGPKSDSSPKEGAKPKSAQNGEEEKNGEADASKAGDKDAAKKDVDFSELPPDNKAEQAELKNLGEKFQVFRTQHFSVLHNVSDAQVKAFATAIEKTYRSNLNYTMSLDIVPKPPKRKLLIYYFAEHDSYTNYSKKIEKGERPQSQPGVFFPDINRSMFYDFRNQDSFKKAREEADTKVADLKKRLSAGKVSPDERKKINQQINEAKAQSNRSGVVGGGYTESIVQHEVTHHVLWNVGLHNPKNFPANPRWFAEGTAMMFETTASAKSANIGAVNKNRLEEYQMLARANRLFDLKEFVSSPAFFASEATIGSAYAQSWALAHYLNRTKRNRIKGFVDAINKRPADYESTPEKELKTFEAAFGKVDEKWILQWKNWMKNVR